ncbi:MAG: ABC transporter ATP-binding protein [Bacteriovoracaceae bacterium]
MEAAPLRFWYQFLLRHKGTYFVGVLSILLTGFTQVFSTRITGWIIDFFQKTNLPGFLKFSENYETQFLFLVGSLLASRILLTVGRFGWRRFLARLSHIAGMELKFNIWDHVRFFNKRDFQTQFSKGVLMNASTSDVNSAKFIFGFSLVAFLDVIILGMTTIIVMLTIDIKLTLLSLSVLVLIPFLVRKLSAQEMVRYEKSQQELSVFNDQVTQCVSSIRLQRVTQTGEFWTRRLGKVAEHYRFTRLLSVFTSLKYFPVMGGVSVASYVVLFFVGLDSVFSGAITVGDFVAMQGLILLVQDPLLELGYIISDWKRAGTSLKRIFDIIDHPKDASLLNEPIELSIEDQAVDEIPVFEVTGLTFNYPQNDIKIFNNFDLKIKKGSRVGFMGPIGSGKSTLVQILAGLERSHKGEVLYYGKNFDQYRQQELRSSMAIVPQKPFLFASTIKDNINMDRGLDDERIWDLLRLVELEEDVKGFEHGIETELGEWGINLSGGQKQRLTIARALSRDVDVLFLDDCLSAVDTVTEEKILKNLNLELKDKTIVWVAHRESTLRYCEQIIEFESLEIEDSGLGYEQELHT